MSRYKKSGGEIKNAQQHDRLKQGVEAGAYRGQRGHGGLIIAMGERERGWREGDGRMI